MLGSETARRVLSREKKIQKLARLDGETQINIKREKIRSKILRSQLLLEPLILYITL